MEIMGKSVCVCLCKVKPPYNITFHLAPEIMVYGGLTVCTYRVLILQQKNYGIHNILHVSVEGRGVISIIYILGGLSFLQTSFGNSDS